MNTAPLNIRQLNDKDVGKKFSQMQTVYGNLETMTTVPTDRTVPAFNGLRDIPEQHTFLITISEGRPNSAGGNQSAITVGEKRLEYPVISIRTTENKHLESGQIAHIFEAAWRRFAINRSEFLTDHKKLERPVSINAGGVVYKVLGTTDPNKNYRTHFNGDPPASPGGAAVEMAVDLAAPRTDFVQAIIDAIEQRHTGFVTPPGGRGGDGGTGGVRRSAGWSLFTGSPPGPPRRRRRVGWASPQSCDGGSTRDGSAATTPLGPSGRPRCMFGHNCPTRNAGCPCDHS